MMDYKVNFKTKTMEWKTKYNGLVDYVKGKKLYLHHIVISGLGTSNGSEGCFEIYSHKNEALTLSDLISILHDFGSNDNSGINGRTKAINYMTGNEKYFFGQANLRYGSDSYIVVNVSKLYFNYNSSTHELTSISMTNGATTINSNNNITDVFVEI